ncbi:MAG TPA: hypothetical protein VHM70_17730, partial [Polyangiaceae bacterium]|nr:hypothetical protein [Polyangiaceae bacterium]
MVEIRRLVVLPRDELLSQKNDRQDWTTTFGVGLKVSSEAHLHPAEPGLKILVSSRVERVVVAALRSGSAESGAKGPRAFCSRLLPLANETHQMRRPLTKYDAHPASSAGKR